VELVEHVGYCGRYCQPTSLTQLLRRQYRSTWCVVARAISAMPEVYRVPDEVKRKDWRWSVMMGEGQASS